MSLSQDVVAVLGYSDPSSELTQPTALLMLKDLLIKFPEHETMLGADFVASFLALVTMIHKDHSEQLFLILRENGTNRFLRHLAKLLYTTPLSSDRALLLGGLVFLERLFRDTPSTHPDLGLLDRQTVDGVVQLVWKLLTNSVEGDDIFLQCLLCFDAIISCPYHPDAKHNAKRELLIDQLTKVRARCADNPPCLALLDPLLHTLARLQNQQHSTMTTSESSSLTSSAAAVSETKEPPKVEETRAETTVQTTIETVIEPEKQATTTEETENVATRSQGREDVATTIRPKEDSPQQEEKQPSENRSQHEEQAISETTRQHTADIQESTQTTSSDCESLSSDNNGDINKNDNNDNNSNKIDNNNNEDSSSSWRRDENAVETPQDIDSSSSAAVVSSDSPDMSPPESEEGSISMHLPSLAALLATTTSATDTPPERTEDITTSTFTTEAPTLVFTPPERTEEPQVEGEETWAYVQRKTFTRWVNRRLNQRAMKITNLYEACGDGVMLCNLIEVCAGVNIGQWSESPKSLFQKLRNLNVCLDYLMLRVKLVNVGASDLIEGNRRIILGLIWSVILLFGNLDNTGDNSTPRQALLEWVNHTILPYRQRFGLSTITNFTTCFMDGRVLSALCDSLHPGLISTVSSDPLLATATAMGLAEQHFDLPQFLDAFDVVNTPDEPSIMCYVSLYREIAATLVREVDPLKCVVEGEGVVSGVKNNILRFLVVTRSEDGKLTFCSAKQPLKIIISDPLNQIVECTVVWNLFTGYECSYLASEIGNYRIRITVGGKSVCAPPRDTGSETKLEGEVQEESQGMYSIAESDTTNGAVDIIETERTGMEDSLVSANQENTNHDEGGVENKSGGRGEESGIGEEHRRVEESGKGEERKEEESGSSNSDNQDCSSALNNDVTISGSDKIDDCGSEVGGRFGSSGDGSNGEAGGEIVGSTDNNDNDDNANEKTGSGGSAHNGGQFGSNEAGENSGGDVDSDVAAVSVREAAQLLSSPDQKGDNADFICHVVSNTREIILPPSEGVMCVVYDKYKNYRSYITLTGDCVNKFGEVLAHLVEQDGLEVYSPTDPPVFWGNVESDCVYNNYERKIGGIQMDKGWIRDEGGSTVCELTRIGEASGRFGTFLGQFEGFTYHRMQYVALYLLLVDSDMLVEEAEES